MRDADALTRTAQAARGIAPRDFLWLMPRDRETGDIKPVGFWSDAGDVDVPVIEPVTGVSVTRTYRGAGDMVEVDPFALATGLAVQTVPIRLSQITPDAAQAVRGYDLRGAPVELHRGFLDPASGLLVAPARLWFSGEVDTAPISTPPEGQTGGIDITVKSYAQELTRTSSATRSDADQRGRDPSDAFFQHAATVGKWKIFWGQGSE